MLRSRSFEGAEGLPKERDYEEFDDMKRNKPHKSLVIEGIGNVDDSMQSVDFAKFVKSAMPDLDKADRRVRDVVPQFLQKLDEESTSLSARHELERMFASSASAAPARSAASGPNVVRHADASSSSSAKPKNYGAQAAFYCSKRPMSLREMNRLNLKRNHGIIITEEDEIDLEHTSCEEGDHDHSPFEGFSDTDEDMIEKSILEDQAEKYFQGGDDLTDDSGDEEGSMVASILRKKRRRSRAMHKARVDSSESSSTKRRKRQSAASQAGKAKVCFLCNWGKYNYDIVENEHMRALLSLIYDNIGEIDTKIIALAVHQYYKQIIVPAARCQDQYLPPWRSKDVFICLSTHNSLPELKLVEDLADLQVLKNYLKGHLSHIMEDEEGNEVDVPNFNVIKTYTGIQKSIWQLYNLKTSTMNFHNQGKNVKLGNNQRSFRSVKLRNNDRRKVSVLK